MAMKSTTYYIGVDPTVHVASGCTLSCETNCQLACHRRYHHPYCCLCCIWDQRFMGVPKLLEAVDCCMFLALAHDRPLHLLETAKQREPENILEMGIWHETTTQLEGFPKCGYPGRPPNIRVSGPFYCWNNHAWWLGAPIRQKNIDFLGAAALQQLVTPGLKNFIIPSKMFSCNVRNTKPVRTHWEATKNQLTSCKIGLNCLTERQLLTQKNWLSQGLAESLVGNEDRIPDCTRECLVPCHLPGSPWWKGQRRNDSKILVWYIYI